MVDVDVFGGCCPRCDGDVEATDSYDAPDGTPVSKQRCTECGHEFTVVQLWIIDESWSGIRMVKDKIGGG